MMGFGGVADKKAEGRSPDYRSAAVGRGERRGVGAPTAERRARATGPAPTSATSLCASGRSVKAAATVINARVRNFAVGVAPKREAVGRRGLGAGRESYAQHRTQRLDGRAEKRTPTSGRARSLHLAERLGDTARARNVATTRQPKGTRGATGTAKRTSPGGRARAERRALASRGVRGGGRGSGGLTSKGGWMPCECVSRAKPGHTQGTRRPDGKMNWGKHHAHTRTPRGKSGALGVFHSGAARNTPRAPHDRHDELTGELDEPPKIAALR